MEGPLSEVKTTSVLLSIFKSFKSWRTSHPSPEKFPASPPPRAPEASHIELGRKLRDVFRQFNAPVEFAGDPIVGPAFLRFPVRPARGIRPEAIRKLSTALQVRLGLKTLPFIHNPGGRMVVDVERSDREIVPFSSIRDQLP